MRRHLFAAGLACAVAAPADAQEYTPITERETFLSLLQGRQLQMRIYGLSLNVLPDGRIEGSAVGWDIDGSWTWQDGYFCREMDWSGYEIPFNCQLVEVLGDDRLRFTVDQGAGDSAEFRLR